MPASRRAIVAYLNDLLNIAAIQDSSCNGLQVEGAEEITKIGLAVDACLNVYEKALSQGCQMVLVHHGLIWGGLKSITGPVHRQLEFLLCNGINLYAAHLPLDAHPEYGNNILLARMLGLSEIRQFGLYKGISIGFEGAARPPLSNEEIGRRLQASLGGSFSVLPFGKPENSRIAIVSGGGSDAIGEAIEKGIDCFVTGEPLHWNHHAALEARLSVVYCGHYHTETVGVKALGAHVKEKFNVGTVFIDEPTLV